MFLSAASFLLPSWPAYGVLGPPALRSTIPNRALWPRSSSRTKPKDTTMNTSGIPITLAVIGCGQRGKVHISHRRPLSKLTSTTELRSLRPRSTSSMQRRRDRRASRQHPHPLRQGARSRRYPRLRYVARSPQGIRRVTRDRRKTPGRRCHRRCTRPYAQGRRLGLCPAGISYLVRETDGNGLARSR